jgi:hypothetical protein
MPLELVLVASRAHARIDGFKGHVTRQFVEGDS